MTKIQLLGLQATVSAVVAAITDRTGILFYMLIILMTVMVIDYISGMMASKTEALEHPGDPSYGWSSRKGALGIQKKFGYIFVVTVAILIDWIIMWAGSSVGVSMPAKTFFGLLVTVWYILNECLSIIENAGRMGAEIPSFLQEIISVLKDKTEKRGDNGIGTTDRRDGV